MVQKDGIQEKVWIVSPTMYKIMKDWEKNGFDFPAKTKHCIENYGEIDLEKYLRILKKAESMYWLIKRFMTPPGFPADELKEWNMDMLKEFGKIIKEVEG